MRPDRDRLVEIGLFGVILALGLGLRAPWLAAAAPAGAAADQRMVEQAKAALKRAQAEQKAVEDFAAKQQ
jgi:hypothetical protein